MDVSTLKNCNDVHIWRVVYKQWDYQDKLTNARQRDVSAPSAIQAVRKLRDLAGSGGRIEISNVNWVTEIDIQ